MAATVQITQLSTYATAPPPVAKVVITSLSTLGTPANLSGVTYVRRSGAWVNTNVSRRVRVNGAWVAL